MARVISLTDNYGNLFGYVEVKPDFPSTPKAVEIAAGDHKGVYVADGIGYGSGPENYTMLVADEIDGASISRDPPKS